jgi:hypothetical protein
MPIAGLRGPLFLAEANWRPRSLLSAHAQAKPRNDPRRTHGINIMVWGKRHKEQMISITIDLSSSQGKRLDEECC